MAASQPKNIDGGIDISIEDQPARTHHSPHVETDGFRESLATGGTRLARVRWVYFDDHTPSLRRFGVQPGSEVTPACIHDALGQMAVR